MPFVTAARDPGGRRLDIQGLRAVAVLMVIAYHAGLPLPGGFSGVDVFFVISGFVITAMLDREWTTTGRISLPQFYIRRFKRLTPALALTVATVMVIASVALSPFGAEQTAAKTAVGAMLLSANWVIHITTGRYFDAPADTNPLLNTWSLSVEEQFYLAFPLLLTMAWTLARRGSRWRATPLLIVAAVTGASFALAWLASTGHAPYRTHWAVGFYGPVGRAWEFAVGALLALLQTRLIIRSNALATAVAGTGAAMIAASLLVINKATPFPGVWTLLPVTGTLLLLYAGSQPDNVITRALSTRPFVRVGDWSYSLYLWHWPFIVFATTLWPAAWQAPLVAALVSIVPALLSYHRVEQPIRAMRIRTRTGWARLTASVVLTPLLLAGGLMFVAERVWGAKFATGELPAAVRGDIGHSAFDAFVATLSHPCVPEPLPQNPATTLLPEGCTQSKPGAGISIAIVGDSHARHLFPGLAKTLPEENVGVISPALPLLGAARPQGDVAAYLANNPNLRAVIVNMQWLGKGVPADALVPGLTEIARAGKRVFVMDDIPDFRFDPYVCKYGKIPLFAWTECTQDAARFWRVRYAGFAANLQRVVQQVPGAQLLRTAQYFCSDADCAMVRDGVILYRDRDHLNLEGSIYVADRILRDYPEFRAVVARAHRQ